MARHNRNDWLQAAFAALAEAGVDEVRINALCARVGATKGSLYWHFEGRDALLDAMLTAWEAEATSDIIARIDSTKREPAARLRALARTVFAETEQIDRIESAIRAWASKDPRARSTVDRVDERRLSYVRDLLRGAGLPSRVANHRSAIFYRALIGEFTWRSHGGAPMSRAAVQELIALVLSDPQGG